MAASWFKEPNITDEIEEYRVPTYTSLTSTVLFIGELLYLNHGIVGPQIRIRTREYLEFFFQDQKQEVSKPRTPPEPRFST